MPPVISMSNGVKYMSETVELIDKNRLPGHIAIIMDGNGRWAEAKGEDRLFGHFHGVTSVRNTVEACAELGIGYLTLYAFSTENWQRPGDEVEGLMELLVQTIENEIKSLHENNIRLQVIGNFSMLPALAQQKLDQAITLTADNTGLTLVMALSYSGRWDISNAGRLIAEKVAKGQLTPEAITEDTVKEHLSTSGIPYPELMIRTSGVYRISNFLLYELAYAELYFTPVCWPDFDKKELYNAIISYQQRERRFGKTGQQIRV